MLARFFNKSKPINYFLLSIMLIIGVLVVGYKQSMGFNGVELLKLVGIGFFLVFLMLLLGFIVRKNSLTQANTFSIFFFSWFLLGLFKNTNILYLLFSLFFLLLAYRRIFNLQNHKNTTKKILDASVWISIATLFYFWNILFFIPLYIALLQLPESKVRYFAIPVFGVLAIGSITTAYYVVFHDNLYWFLERIPHFSLDFSAYGSLKVLVSVTFLIGLILWSVSSELLAFKTLSLKQKPNRRMVFIILATSFAVALLFPQKTGQELILVLPPASIIIANYVEKHNEIWFNEMVMWFTFLVTASFFFI